MSYTALYRKWRPKTFDEVIGQEAICTTLKNQIKSGRIAHAYVFCGTRGTGKTSVAKIMARAVNCSSSSDGNPCNECDICKSILNNTSINVVEMDAASNNRVEDARGIIEKVAYPPTEGKYKVFIIDEAHMLTKEAFNALLKTLEEPPEYAIFILATTEVNKIPITILSRCQRYDFKRISVGTISDRLKELSKKENISIDDKAIEYIAKRADGAMRDALSLLDECIAFHPNEDISYERVLDILGAVDIAIYDKLYNDIVSMDISSALDTLEETVKAGRELGQFVIDFLGYLRNLLVIKTMSDPSNIIDASKESIEHMKESSSKATNEQLMRYIKTLAELSNNIRYSNQKRVLIELAIIKLATPSMETNLDSLLERVASLEKKLSNAAVQSIDTPKESAKAVTDTKENKSIAQRRVVELPKAKYDQLMSVKKGWGNIVSELPMGGNAILSDTKVEPGNDNRIIIAFSSDMKAEMATDSIMSAIKAEIAKQLGIDVELEKRVKKSDERDNIDYRPTKEDIEATINMEVTMID